MNAWTTTTWVSAGALALVVLLALVLAVALVRSRAQTRAALTTAREAQEELSRRLDQLERPLAAASAAPEPVAEFVITDVGTPLDTGADGRAAAPSRIEGRLFVDIVARETVVKAASWTYGLRRALSAENRNRIKFEMRRETKRATKQRRSDVKEALRLYYAQQESREADDRQEGVA